MTLNALVHLLLVTFAGLWFAKSEASYDPSTMTIDKLVTEKQLVYRLTTPDEVNALLGNPIQIKERIDGGMSLQIQEYKNFYLYFGRMKNETTQPYVLRRVEVNGKEIEIGQNSQLILRNENDLKKLDKFWGVADVSLTALDLRKASAWLSETVFDTLTRWPERSQLPPNFDPGARLEAGKDPGLGIRSLHQQGINGHGISIGIIDQPLLLGHQEYTSRLIFYQAFGLSNIEPQMHASPVASIAVGKTLGVAPKANLIFFAVPTWKLDDADYAKALDAIVEWNKQALPNERIRSVSISFGGFSNAKNSQLWKPSLNRAESSGIFVATCDPDFLKYDGLSRKIDGNANDPADYVRVPWANKDNILYVPISNRTVASHRGNDVYTFDTGGGLSWGAPYLAGLAALAFQVNDKITPVAIRELLVSTAYSVPAGPIVNPINFIQDVQTWKSNSIK